MRTVADLYVLPFSYDPNDQSVRDANNERVLDIRGWGRIQYIDPSGKLQDEVGQHVATTLTSYWTKAQ
jgi:hypothetical protein